MLSLQGSLFESTSTAPVWQPLPRARRVVLGGGAWIDHLPGWLAGATDELFARLCQEVPWRAERRMMYDREVAVPRLLCFYGEGDQLPHPLLAQARETLSQHYAEELGEPFRTAGLCLYRDDRDSVPGTATDSGVAAPPTPWSRSSRWATPGACSCAPSRASTAGRPRWRWVTATWW